MECDISEDSASAIDVDSLGSEIDVVVHTTTVSL